MKRGCVRHVLIAGALTIGYASAITAQDTASARPALSLAAVIAATLRTNPTILAGAAQVENGRGALLAADGAFDPQFESTVGRSRGNQLTPSAVDPASLLAVLANQMTYDVGIQKTLRSGIVLKPDISISRSDFSTAPGLATAQSSVQLNATVPLWKDRFGAITASTERAAQYQYDAATLTLRHTVAQAALDAATAYWAYVAALEQLEVFDSSEARAREMLNDTKRLVAAEERAASDVQQAAANLASKRVARIGAEQSVIEARADLGLTIGLAPDAMDTIGLPSTVFPALPDSAHEAAASDLGDVVEHRADYAAAQRNERAAATLAASARDDLRPRLDLTLGVGYVGMANGFGVGRFVAPLYQNVPGLNVSLQLHYALPITNTGAAGRELEQRASYDQQRVARTDLARRIRSNVAVARSALRHGQLELAESHEAVALAETTVRNEQRKFRLDASTMFDVIQAQDALTNAKLNQITSAQRYAVAIARLRFEAGALGLDPGAALDVMPLLTPP
ncbi:MAG: TolC family protein [Gemmatimonadaceae bacterium]